MVQREGSEKKEDKQQSVKQKLKNKYSDLNTELQFWINFWHAAREIGRTWKDHAAHSTPHIHPKNFALSNYMCAIWKYSKKAKLKNIFF